MISQRMPSFTLFLKKYWIAVLFFVLAALLIIGQRFDFRFAGGTGYQAPVFATVIAMQGTGAINHNGTIRPLTAASQIARGEIVTTNPGGYVMLHLFHGGSQNGWVSLDERSTLTIVENDTDGIQLNLGSGRLLAAEQNGSFKIKTGQVESSMESGSMSVINYDFLWQADIWPIKTSVTVTSPADGTFNASSGVQVSTNGSAKETSLAEDFTHGPSAAFYTWVQNN